MMDDYMNLYAAMLKDFPETGLANDDMWLLSHGFRPVDSRMARWSAMAGVRGEAFVERFGTVDGDRLWRAEIILPVLPGVIRTEMKFSTAQNALVELYGLLDERGMLTGI